MAAGSAEARASPGGELAEEARLIQLRGRSTTERADMTEFTILQMHANRPEIRWHTAAGHMHDIAARVMQKPCSFLTVSAFFCLLLVIFFWVLLSGPVGGSGEVLGSTSGGP